MQVLNSNATPLQDIALTSLKGIGPRMAVRMEKLGLYNALDLLFHLPFRYQNRTRVTAIGAARAGMEVVIEGRIVLADVVQGKRRSLLCKVEDSSGIISIRFYYFNNSLRNQLQSGLCIRCIGEVRRGESGLEIYHPEYSLAAEQLAPLTQSLTPVYSTVEGLSQARLRQFIAQALELLKNRAALPELLPEGSYTFSKTAFGKTGIGANISSLITFLHQPPISQLSEQDIALLERLEHPAQLKLAFEELVAHHLSLLRIRQRLQRHQAPALEAKAKLTQVFVKQLAFDLTQAQQRVFEQISQDLQRQQPMLRLVQGDVGCGKTVVATLAALQAIENGYQVALMAPTDILTEQHFNNLRQWLEPLGIQLSRLTGRLTAAQRAEQNELISSGRSQIVVGTHALFQKDVEFARLGLAIIDEQHRFGVHQRLALRQKGARGNDTPHQLVMTATPIPRSLAMCAYADLDLSVIDELPPGRKPVTTIVIGDQRRDEVIRRVRNACAAGRQTYWVCTLIEESEALQGQAAEDTASQLTQQLPELQVGLLHGRMKGAEKSAVMEGFKQHQIDLLVATTVIEVGVDVPNASLMVIENPERLGLAQLHQLRGRVGRGEADSYCVLMYHPPLSQLSKKRLGIMRDIADGFVVAQKDLEIRGPGEVLGTRQAGLMQFKIAQFDQHRDLFEASRHCADQLLLDYPQNVDALAQRWLGTKHIYADV